MKTKHSRDHLFIKIVLIGICIFANSPIFSQEFKSVKDIVSLSISANTGEKPQSKVWTYVDKWWMVLPDSTGTYIWGLKFDNGEYMWVKSLKISDSTNTYADCKSNSNLVHILLFDKSTTPVSSNLLTVEYDIKLESYKMWSLNSVPLCLNFENNSVETATIERDDQNKIWLAYEKDNKINVRWSDSPYLKWSDEINLCEGVKDDDICAVIHLNNKIGIMWSNQNTKNFGFRFHEDFDNPSVWSDNEVPGKENSLDVGDGFADDHLNFAVAKDGTLFCAVKTSYDTVGFTQLGLLKRDPKGKWSKFHKVSESGTRPIVILNESRQNIKVLYKNTESGGNIIYKESNIHKILFNETHVLIENKNHSNYNNVSSIKNNYTSEIVIVASSRNQLASVLAQ